MAGKIWRIGLMGHSSQRDNVRLCLTALGCELEKQKIIQDKNLGLQAADAFATA